MYNLFICIYIPVISKTLFDFKFEQYAYFFRSVYVLPWRPKHKELWSCESCWEGWKSRNENKSVSKFLYNVRGSYRFLLEVKFLTCDHYFLFSKCIQHYNKSEN